MPVLFKEFHDVGCILFSFIPALVDVGKNIAPVKFDKLPFGYAQNFRGTSMGYGFVLDKRVQQQRIAAEFVALIIAYHFLNYQLLIWLKNFSLV